MPTTESEFDPSSAGAASAAQQSENISTTTDTSSSEKVSSGESTQVETPIQKETPRDEQGRFTKVAEDKLVNLDAFEELSGKKPVEKKAEPKEELETSKEEPPAQQPVKQTLQSKKPIQQRDYSGLSEQETSMFKQMNNEAFNTLKPMFLKHKELQQQLAERDARLKELSEKTKSSLPDSYYAHEEAYVFTPEYKQASALVQGADVIYNHWVKQLANARAGKDWQDLDIDEKGNFVLSSPKEASPEAEAMIFKAIQDSADQRREMKARVDGIIQNHKSQYSNLTKFVSDLESKYFPAYSEAELQKPENANVKKLIETGRESLPVALRNNILASPLTKSYALIVNLVQAIKEKDAALEKLKLAKKDERLQQPNETTSGGAPKSKEVSIKDFEALL